MIRAGSLVRFDHAGIQREGRVVSVLGDGRVEIVYRSVPYYRWEGIAYVPRDAVESATARRAGSS